MRTRILLAVASNAVLLGLMLATIGLTAVPGGPAPTEPHSPNTHVIERVLP